MKQLLLGLLASITTTMKFMFAPPDNTAGAAEPSNVQDIAAENAALTAEAAALGIEAPPFPANPAGLAKCRAYLKDAIAAKKSGQPVEIGGAGGQGVTETVDELQENHSKNELLEIAENEDVDDVDEKNTKAEIAEAIVAKRTTTASGSEGE